MIQVQLCTMIHLASVIKGATRPEPPLVVTSQPLINPSSIQAFHYHLKGAVNIIEIDGLSSQVTTQQFLSEILLASANMASHRRNFSVSMPAPGGGMGVHNSGASAHAIVTTPTVASPPLQGA